MYRALILALALLAASAGASRAQDAVEEMTRDLQQQGFSVVEVERTLLGRVLIRAESPRETREVVIDPATGEILRDYTEEKSGGSSALTPPGRVRHFAAAPVPSGQGDTAARARSPGALPAGSLVGSRLSTL